MLFDASFWVFMAFITLFVLLGKRLWVSLTSALDTRVQKIEDDIKKAAQMREEAFILLKTCQRHEIEASEKAAGLLAHAQEEVERLRQKTLSDMKTHREAEERLLQERLRQEEERARHDIRDRAIELAGIAAQKLIHEMQTEEKNDEYFHMSLKKMDHILMEPFFSHNPSK